MRGETVATGGMRGNEEYLRISKRSRWKGKNEEERETTFERNLWGFGKCNGKRNKIELLINWS